MPRGPSTSKRQQGVANQRDTRHENGLVKPGKQIQKQKSNGHLNGHTNGHAKSSDSASSTPPLPATPPPTNGHARYPTPGDNEHDRKMAGGGYRRGSLGGYSDASDGGYQNGPGSPVHENHRQIDVNATKNPAVHRDAGPLSLALTVLKSCPIGDTIAILIVLLQIPPTFLSIVHLLFATLTFVPPSSSSISAFSFTDMVNGALGTPSVATIFFIDILVLLVWLFLWSPLQDIALDLAQTVIALTLGGGTSGKGTGWKNFLCCSSVVLFSHLFRGGNVKPSGLRAFISSSGGLLKSTDPDDILEQPPPGAHKSQHGLVRSILAIHILTQGVVRLIRDWYVRRERRDHSASIGDPEAGKAPVDATNESTTSTQTPDNDSSTSLPVSNPVTLKKKKKQSAQVRIRQPLWAALASTKIVMVKEYETSHTSAESVGTNATDPDNLGDAPFNSEADRIWITYIGSDEVFFSTSFFPTHTAPENCVEKSMDSSGVDVSKPFYVRVNQTIWQPTRINSSNDPDQPTGQGRWSGEIFGLAPMSNYQCDFVSTIDDSVIFSTSVRTARSPTTDLATGISPNPQINGRPGSPITTLKTSIATAEVKLAEERNRQKRERKDQRTRTNALRKEIEKLAGSIASAGGNDDKLKQKVHQSSMHQKQAEELFNSLTSQIEELENTPTEETKLYATSKATYQSERSKHKAHREKLDMTKHAANQTIQALKNELSATQAEKEKLQGRLSKAIQRHGDITEDNAKGLDEAQRREMNRQRKRDERVGLRAYYQRRLHELETEIDNHTLWLTQMEANLQEAYSAQSPATSAQNLNVSFGETIPENSGMNATAAPWTPGPPTSSFYATGYTPMLSTIGTSTPGGLRTRGRSSSMLSNVSGFTQSSGEGPGVSGTGRVTVWSDAREQRKGSSGSGSTQGSVGDPKSPTFANGKVASW